MRSRTAGLAAAPPSGSGEATKQEKRNQQQQRRVTKQQRCMLDKPTVLQQHISNNNTQRSSPGCLVCLHLQLGPEWLLGVVQQCQHTQHTQQYNPARAQTHSLPLTWLLGVLVAAIMHFLLLH